MKQQRMNDNVPTMMEVSVLVRLFWPKCCTFRQRGVCDYLVDAFWVEATRDEAERQVFPFLNETTRLASQQFAARDWYAPRIGDPPRPFCFLVARDLCDIVPFDSRYPVHQLWNAYSPFGGFEPCVFDQLTALQTFTPVKITWLGIQKHQHREG